MIEIKCSKAQFKRILASLTESGMLFNNHQNIPTLWGTVAVKHANNLVKEMETK